MCSPTSKCKDGDGHCNMDDHCQEGLKCGRRNCLFNDSENCCYTPDGMNLPFMILHILLHAIWYVKYGNHNVTYFVLFKVFVYWKPKLPSPKKYFFATRTVDSEGTVAKFSDSFDTSDAELWTIQNSFWAYPDKYTGTKVKHLNEGPIYIYIFYCYYVF